MTILILLLLGFVVGTLVTAMGGGGAAIYLGILTASFHLTPHSAAATSLVTAFLPLLIGAYAYYRQGSIQFSIGSKMLAVALPAVIIGSLIAPSIPELIYRVIIAGILILLGIQILYRNYKPNAPKEFHNRRWFLMVAFGIISGLMVGIGGLSGGGPIVASLLLMGLDTLQATATSSYVLVGMTFVGMLFHISTGAVDWSAGLNLMIGAMIGAFCSPILLGRLNPARLNAIMRPTMGIALVIMGGLSLIS